MSQPDGIPNVNLSPEDVCCCGSDACRELHLSQELDIILNPKVIFQSSSQLERIWPLMTGKQTSVSEFIKTLSEYRTERYCGYAWPPNHVAYRCRTCSKTLAMSICADCFIAGNHEGHDYNMFRSRSGGACDCGSNIVKESGHCSRHGNNAKAKRFLEEIPKNLTCRPKRIIPRLIHRLAIQLRRSHVDLSGETDIYLDFLTQMADSSAVIRGLISETLISEEAYSSQVRELSNHRDYDTSRVVKEGLKKLKRELKELAMFRIPEDWPSSRATRSHQFDSLEHADPPKGMVWREPKPKPLSPRTSQKLNLDDWTCVMKSTICENYKISTFIDEILAWVVIFEFPQKLVCFILSFIMNEQYKKVFARAFVKHYPHIAMILAGASPEPRRQLRDSYEKLTRRILQISVQIYMDADLTRVLCEEENALHVIIYCLRIVLETDLKSGGSGAVLMDNPLCLHFTDPPKVVCCDNRIIRDRHLSSLTDDLNSILEFDHEAYRLIGDSDLLQTWLGMLCYLQTMSSYRRKLYEHTPYDTGPHIFVFTVEAELCLGPMWTILGHLKDRSCLPMARSLLEALHKTLAIWFHEMGILPHSYLDPYHMSFHIPLHRMLAATIRHMLFTLRIPSSQIYRCIKNNQESFIELGDYKQALGLLISTEVDDFFKTLLLHPLQAITLYHEMRSGIWARNGSMIINQAVTYVHCANCHSTIDLDIFLLRYCATMIDPNLFLKMVISKFHVWNWFSFKSNTLANNMTPRDIRRLYNFNILPEQITQMVENCLLTLIQLLTLSIHCDTNDSSQTKQELIALISVADRSYSYLLEMLPDRSGSEVTDSDGSFSKLLAELADYKPAQHGPGGNLQQGCYTLKPHIWDEEYNPIHVQYRLYQRRDYQLSLERFFQRANAGKLDKRHHSSSLWPPLIVPRDIAVFGQLDLGPLLGCQNLLGVIYSILFKATYICDVPDTIMAYAIHLLELSLRRATKDNQFGFIEQKAFNGVYVFGDLIRAPGSNERQLIGSPITSSFNGSPAFPIVRKSLDLSFDGTWFPFSSSIENCLVHIEEVNCMSAREFHVSIKQAEGKHQETANQDDADEGLETSDMDEQEEGTNGDEDGDTDVGELDDLDFGVEDEGDDLDGIDDGDDDDVDGDRVVVTSNRARGPDDIEEGASLNSGSTNTSATLNIVGGVDTPASNANNSAGTLTISDHTYSALESPMEVDSVPESQSAALSLVRSEPQQERPGQMSPGNLVTERRAILASEPRPMLEGAVQPLALEAATSSRESSSQTVGSYPGSNSAPLPAPQSRSLGNASGNAESHMALSGDERVEERPLSEVEIQTRFMGFFQSRPDTSRPQTARCFQRRQVARRGGGSISVANFRAGYRGVVGPFAVHNPNSDNASTLAPATATAVESGMAIAPPPYARRSVERELHQLRSAARVASQRIANCRASLRRSAQARRLRRDRVAHGDSILTLLLRLHAKYSQQANSYQFQSDRLKTRRTRIGDGVHFVTIALDLICASDGHRMRAKLAQLQSLIWDNASQDMDLGREQTSRIGAPDLGAAEDIGARSSLNPDTKSFQSPDFNPTPNSNQTPDAAERRRRAKQFQSKLMADFANKQRAFIEKYDSLGDSAGEPVRAHGSPATSTPQSTATPEQPINLSAKLSHLDSSGQSQMSDCDKQAKQQLTQEQASDKSSVIPEAPGPTPGTSKSGASGPKAANDITYECCICGVGASSELGTSNSNPLGQVVLLQSSSVFGHSHLRPSEKRRLPCDDPELAALKEETYAKYLEHRIDLLCELFPEASWLDSINIGAEGGVHVQSCGHYLHIECHQSYIKSLDHEDRLRGRNDGDEFLCPVCRQLANSVLPILSLNISDDTIMDVDAPADQLARNLDDQCSSIASLLSNPLPPPDGQFLQSSAAFCAHLPKATAPQYRLVRSGANWHSLFLFLTSIARTNLECELIVRSHYQHTSQLAAKRSCFRLLFHVLALNAQTLINDQWFTCDQIWSHLTHCVDEKNRLSVKPTKSEVPLLLRDPTAVLLQFLFAITSSSLCQRTNFLCLVRILYNLAVIQSLALVVSYLNQRPAAAARKASEFDEVPDGSRDDAGKDRNRNEDCKHKCQLGSKSLSQTDEWSSIGSASSSLTFSQLPQRASETMTPEDMTSANFERLLEMVRFQLSPLLAPETEEPLINPAPRNCWQYLEALANKQQSLVQLACLPFLRAAALIQHHLYGTHFPKLQLNDDEDVTNASSIDADFRSLAASLSLLGKHSAQLVGSQSDSLMQSLRWPRAAGANGFELIKSWSEELLCFNAEFSIAARTLLINRPLIWRRPALMRLPRAFDDIFMFYYRKKCSLCGQIPKDVAVCLVCGAPICFRVSCCKDRSRSRQVHSQHCGANTAVFLAVHTSSIVVIRGSRACVWGSVYLDAHDEEDNGLQRGKPLYLVPARFELLEQQWLTHVFDHTCGKRWIYLHENQ